MPQEETINRFRNTSGWMANRGVGAVRSYLGSSVHRTGVRWAKEMYGIGGGMGKLGRGLGLGYAAYTAFQGYQEGGLSGAIGGLARGAAETYAMGAGFKALGIAAGGVAGAVGAGAAVLGGAAVMAGFYGMAAGGVSPQQFLARPYVREHMRKHAKLEMGRPVIDQFGTVATMRQRSLAAMQNSKINGRSAIGNEASLLYRPYFR